MSTFPDVNLGETLELQLNGTWTSVTSRLDHPPMRITRGHPDESTTVSQSSLGAVLSNTDAALSDSNPLSPYWPYLVVNTPMRASIPSDQPYLRLEQDQASGASCPFAAPLGITGDLDVRVDVLLTDLSGETLAGCWGSPGTFSWTLATGVFPEFFWSPDGSSIQSATATARVPPGRFALRVTLAVATGTVTFWTGPGGGADAGPWTQLGNAIVVGATSLHAASTALQAGITGLAPGMYGRLYELEVRAGLGGTVEAHPVFSAQAAGTTSFSDAQSNTWTLSGTSELSARDYRGHFELAEMPQQQEPYDPGATGQAAVTRPVTVAAVGGGLLRRLGQRNNAVNSPLWRYWVISVNNASGFAPGTLASYHPLEDGAGAASLASGTGGPAAQYSGPLQLASNSDIIGSSPLPVLNGAVITGRVPAYAAGWPGNVISWVMEIPGAGEANGSEVIRIATTGTIAQAVITYATGGQLTLAFYNSAGTSLSSTVIDVNGFATPWDANGQGVLCQLQLAPSGGNVAWEFLAYAQSTSAPLAVATGTVTAATTGAVTGWVINSGGQLTGTVCGHVAVQADAVPPNLAFAPGPLTAWAGEAAGKRFQRLCGESGIQYRVMGNPANTVLMGAQTQQTLVALLQEVADADRGAWFELRQALGWGYVPRSALYNQQAAVAVTYAADNISIWPADPTKDDQTISNDVTVTQATGGASARQYAAPGQAINGGRLSTLPPPNGCGTYDGGGTSLNIWQAADLPSEASWLVHAGTVDEQRFPGITLDLTNRALASQFYTILALDLGQKLTVSSPPAHLGPNDISQLAQQLTEVIGPRQLEITVTGVPSKPYAVAREGASTAHSDTDGTTLASPVTSSAAGLSLATAAGLPPWTTSPADYPFDLNVSGERVCALCAGTVINSNPSLAGLTGWTPSNSTDVLDSTYRRTTSLPAVLITPNGSSSSGGLNASSPTAAGTITAAASYIVTCLCYSPQGWSDVRASIDWYNSSGTFLSSGLGSATVLPAGQWTVLTQTLTAPASASECVARFRWGSTAPSSVQFWVQAITVVAASGVSTSSPQAVSVVRSVNGVVKAQSSGTPVSLWSLPVAPL